MEGDSAGGSAESGRDREYQAILPLRGKPLNVEKARLENLLNNEEITSLISAVGVDIGNSEDVSKIKIWQDHHHDRRGRGRPAHPHALLTFFYRQMAKLVEEGHIFVARPPLYKVTQKKERALRATVEEMTRELMERGLRGTRLTVDAAAPADGSEPPAPVVLEGEELSGPDQGDGAAGRRPDDPGAQRHEPERLLTLAGERRLPMYRFLFAGREEFWLHAGGGAFRAGAGVAGPRCWSWATEARAGRRPTATPTGRGRDVPREELHKVRKVNRGLEELQKYGLAATDLVPPLRLAGREPPPRLVLESGDHQHTLAHLRDLVADVRKLGERGLTVTRFKGLGEMDPEELWETTLDPEKRTLMRVQLDDALKADEMFRTLMGEKVEPRREFITNMRWRSRTWICTRGKSPVQRGNEESKRGSIYYRG